MRARNMALCALFAALLTVCAWLSLPVAEIAFTLQTLGVFLALGLLGGKLGTAAIAVYLVMGAVGLPVFTGFRGGIGVLLGATGGYIWGFLGAGITYWCITALGKENGTVRFIAMLSGQLVCYTLGTLWFWLAYLWQDSGMALLPILAKSVLPYLLPDGAKLLLAWLLTKRLKPFVY